MHVYNNVLTTAYIMKIESNNILISIYLYN